MLRPLTICEPSLLFICASGSHCHPWDHPQHAVDGFIALQAVLLVGEDASESTDGANRDTEVSDLYDDDKAVEQGHICHLSALKRASHALEGTVVHRDHWR